MEHSWRCSDCPHEFSCGDEWREHLQEIHHVLFNDSQFEVASKMAEQRRPQSIETQQCPLCLCTPGKSRRTFATHVGRHMEGSKLYPRNKDWSILCHLTNTDSRPPQLPSRHCPANQHPVQTPILNCMTIMQWTRTMCFRKSQRFFPRQPPDWYQKETSFSATDTTKQERRRSRLQDTS